MNNTVRITVKPFDRPEVVFPEVRQSNVSDGILALVIGDDTITAFPLTAIERYDVEFPDGFPQAEEEAEAE